MYIGFLWQTVVIFTLNYKILYKTGRTLMRCTIQSVQSVHKNASELRTKHLKHNIFNNQVRTNQWHPYFVPVIKPPPTLIPPVSNKFPLLYLFCLFVILENSCPCLCLSSNLLVQELNCQCLVYRWLLLIPVHVFCATCQEYCTKKWNLPPKHFPSVQSPSPSPAPFPVYNMKHPAVLGIRSHNSYSF